MLSRLVSKLGAVRSADIYVGPQTAEQEVSVSTSGSAVRVIDNAPDAMSLLLVNSGANDVYVGLTPQVTSGSGMLIPKGSPPVAFNFRDNQNLPGREWWALSPAGASRLYALRVIYVD